MTYTSAICKQRKTGARLCSVLAAVGCLPALAAALPPGNAADITQFSLAHKATGITRGPDGNLWFAADSGTIIGRSSPSGRIDEFPVPGVDSNAGYFVGICSGPDGNLWFADAGNSAIGRITMSGTITEFPLPTAGTVPRNITAGPDGALWFTEQIGSRIGRITTSGAFSEFPTTGRPDGIAAGPDGNLWFTQSRLTDCGTDFCSTVVAAIGVITPQGTIREYALSAGTRTLPGAITQGPDGALWFTEILLTGPEFNTGGGSIGRITTTGSISEFSLPTADAQPAGITLGPDGNLWFTEFAKNQVAKIRPTGTVNEFPLPNANSQPDAIALGGDGNLWFTEPGITSLGRIAAGAGSPAKIDGYMSGNWYNAGQAGHGFQLEMTDTKSMLAVWFVYTPDGTGQAWIFAQGPYDAASNTVTLPAEILTGARFPPNFHAGDVHEQGGTLWGTITFTFSDCNTGSVSWHSDMPGYNQANDTPLPLSRLTRIAGTSCP